MNKLYCLIGPSGSGKDTLKYKSGLPYVVSYRTRKRRVGEVQGKDGYFISRDQFKLIEPQMIAKTEYHNNLYGVTLNQLKKLQTDNMLYVIDYDGYKYMTQKINEKKLNIETVSIFIDIDPSQLEKRMINQNRSHDEINKRLAKLAIDLSAKDKCDYVINNKTTIDDAVKQLNNIIKK